MQRVLAAFAGSVVLMSVVGGSQPLQGQPPKTDAPKAKGKNEPPRSDVERRSPRDEADGFTIHLEPEFALENGPVVYRIRLVNRTDHTLECFRHTHESPVRFTRTPEWVRKARPDFEMMCIFGQYGPYLEKVEGEKFATELIAVHDAYQRIPPGRFSVEFEWDIFGAERRDWSESPRSLGIRILPEFGEDYTRVPVRDCQTVTVQPGTPENVRRVKEKLERWLAAAAANKSSIREVVNSLTGSRHPEFVPLMIRAVQLWEDYDCRDLLDTVYDSFPDPTAGFERLLPLLEAGDPASQPILRYWDLQAFLWVVHQRQLADLQDLKAGKREVHERLDMTEWAWNRIKNEQEVWTLSRTHSNSRLTLEQHARVQSVKNVWVRALYWQLFPEWCSSYWVLSLYADLKRELLPPDAKTVEVICQGLAHDRYAVRERAMADAMKMDERVIPALRNYLRLHPSAEFARRIDQIAKQIQQRPVPPLAVRVIESAMYGGQFQGELIFEALSALPGTCKLSDFIREKRPEQQKRRQEELKRKRELERLHSGK